MAAVEKTYAEIDDDFRDALLGDAIAAFHAMLVIDPDLDRARLKLALAFLLKHEDTPARQHFEDALANNVTEAVKRSVSLYLAQIRARKH